MLRRNLPQRRTCHFCNNSTEGPPNHDFQCPACGSWNLFDRNGKLRSDHPAMYDEALNANSFSKRASPNKNRLPSSFPSNVFCHTCRTNQTLTINMLSNYLPPSSDPSYSKLLAEFPAYKASLYARYPTVCARCQPAVEEQIGQKDSMARSSALGGWLEASNRRNNTNIGGGGVAPTGAGGGLVIAWNIRRALWNLSLIWWIYRGIAGSVGYPNSPPLSPLLNISVAVASLAWQFWDPKWQELRMLRLQGREARAEGRGAWKWCQGLIWIVRLALSIVISLEIVAIPWSVFAAISLFEILINLIAYRHLRIIQPQRIRLVASSRTTTPAPGHSTDSLDPNPAFGQPPVDVPALSALSLSPFPTSRPTHAVNPIFGVTSLPQSPARPRISTYSGECEADAMDWTPATGGAREDNTDWLKPPRFAPEKPTGLEGLLEKFGIAGDEAQEANGNAPQSVGQSSAGVGRGMLIGVFVGIGAVALAAGLALREPLRLGGWRKPADA